MVVDVVVTDKQGKPATGLRPEDFEIEENGKPQKISTFVPAGENLAASQPLPPGIYSNKPQYRLPGGPIVVMLLDAVNTPYSDQAYARRQMLAFVQNSSSPDSGWRFSLSPARCMCCRTSPVTRKSWRRRCNATVLSAEFVNGGRPETSAAAGNATAISTVAAVDASTPPSNFGG